MAQLVSDDFNGASGQTLDAYNPNWVKVSGTGGTLSITDDGAIRNISGSTAAYYRQDATPNSPDYAVSANVVAGGFPGVCVRVSPSTNTFYYARLSSGGTVEVYRAFNGSLSLLGNGATSGTSHLKIECIGSLLNVYVNGDPTPLFSVTDTRITDAGVPGVRINSVTSGRIDNFSADTIAAGSYLLPVSGAQLVAASGNVAMRASRRLSAEPASLTIAPVPVGMRASRKLTVAPAALTLATGGVALLASRRLSVTPAAMVMTGGDVSMLYAPNPEPGSYTLPVSAAAMTLTGGNVGMRVTRRLRVEPASLALAGGAVRTLVGRRLMVSPAGLQLVGGTVTLRFSARGEPFDITKIHPSRVVVFEGSGSRVTPFEGSGSRVTPFAGSGSRVTPFGSTGNRTVRFE